MPDDHSDRENLLQETRALINIAKAKFSKLAFAAERQAAAAKTRALRSAHRSAKRLPTKVANRRARQKRYKLRIAAARTVEREAVRLEAAALLADLPNEPVAVDAQALAAEEIAFRAWIETPGRQQGAARGIEKRMPGEIMVTRKALLLARAEGTDVSWQGYAERFEAATGRAWSREQARRRVAFLTDLEAPGGPWQASPGGVRVFEALSAVCGS